MKTSLATVPTLRNPTLRNLLLIAALVATTSGCGMRWLVPAEKILVILLEDVTKAMNQDRESAVADVASIRPREGETLSSAGEAIWAAARQHKAETLALGPTDRLFKVNIKGVLTLVLFTEHDYQDTDALRESDLLRMNMDAAITENQKLRAGGEVFQYYMVFKKGSPQS